MIGMSVETPDGVGIVMDHDWCDGDTGMGINPAWVHNTVWVKFPDGSEESYDIDDVRRGAR